MSTVPIPRLPNPLTPETIEGLMKARPYWDTSHPRFGIYHRLVQRGFEIMYPGPTRHDEFGKRIDDPPQPPERIAHLVAEENREMEALDRVINGESGGTVHVRAHTRVVDGKAVEVSAYERTAPEGSGGEAGSNPESRATPGSPDLQNMPYHPDRDREKLAPLGPATKKDWRSEIQLLADKDGAADARSSAASEGETGDKTGDTELAERPDASGTDNKEFLDRISKAEQSFDKPGGGYGEHNPESNELGRYQIKPGTLEGIDWRNPDGTWTNKAREHGVESDADFLNNPAAQEAAAKDMLRQYQKEAERKGLYDRIGQKVEGKKAEIEVTEAGIIAATHAEGATATRNYFNKIEGADYRSKDLPLTIKEARIETRLREFQDAPYTRVRKQ